MILYFCASLLTLFNPVNNYYSIINAAEVTLIQGDYSAALKLYDSAFIVQPIPLGQDLYNASLCALRLRDIKKAKDLSLRLGDKGVGPEFFIKNRCYQNIQSDTCWRSFIDQLTDRYEKFRLRNKNDLQYFAGIRDKSTQVLTNYHLEPTFENRRELEWTCDSLAQNFLAYLQTNGYPSEEQLGIAITNDTVIDGRPVFDFILARRPLFVNIHLDSTFQNQLYFKAINHCKLKPELIFELLRSNSNWDFEQIRSHYSLFQGNLYRRVWPPKDKLDSIRALMGVISLEDELSKIKFAFSTGRDQFSLNVFLVEQYTAPLPPKELKAYLKSHELVVKNLSGL